MIYLVNESSPGAEIVMDLLPVLCSAERVYDAYLCDFVLGIWAIDLCGAAISQGGDDDDRILLCPESL
jgi:hypothetical protein